MLAALRQPFPVTQVKKNPAGLDYVSIDDYISRLLDTLGLAYDFRVTQSSVTLLPEDIKTSSGKRQYLAQVTAELALHGTTPNYNGVGGTGQMKQRTTRSGVGADVSFDADKAVKTAQAEALKKAAHQFGIALELWDADHRDLLERQRKLTSDTGIKREVWRIAKERLAKDKPTMKEIGALFNVEPGQLAEPETLRQILVTEGVL